MKRPSDHSAGETLNGVLESLRQERDAYSQELFESERTVAWLAQERQGLLEQVAYLESLPRSGEPPTSTQAKLANAEENVRLSAVYISELEAWITRLETELSDLRRDSERVRATAGQG